MLIGNKGNPASDVWVVVDKPLSNDKDKGYLYSSGLGYVFDKMMQDAGIADYYVISVRPDTEHTDSYRNIIAECNHYKPRIIIPLDAVGTNFLPQLIPKRKDKNYDENEDSEIFKYAGSILPSPYLNYPHYCIPTLPPDVIVRQYKLRDQVVSCDLAKAASELEWIKKHGTVQPPTQRECKIDFESFDELLFIIDSFRNYPIISNDIETIYPRDKSRFKGIHPGYPLTIGLAPSKDFGISFDLFRESTTETVELWKHLNDLIKSVPQLGQNFFNFDLNFYECLGFEIKVEDIQDTLIRHHILWPELPHKLQFQTRQYTREPYYKDEGHGWSIKDMRGLKRYNCLDVCVTMEIWEEQEKEFDERPYLR